MKKVSAVVDTMNNNMVMKNSWPYLAKTTCREGYYELHSGNQ